MRIKILTLGLICFFIFAYCNSPADPEIEKALDPGNPDPTIVLNFPTINYFTATPSQILWGESFVLAWHVTDENWHISNLYWSIKDHKGVLWFESTRTDNPWGEHAVPMRPDYLGDWSYDVITTFTLTAKNDAGQVQESCTIETPPNLAEVVMTHGPTGVFYSNFYHVTGGVKNIGSLPAFNTKVSVDLYGSYGDLLASGECMVGGDGFRFEPQYSAGWQIEFSGDIYYILYREMGSGSEIRYEITWDESP